MYVPELRHTGRKPRLQLQQPMQCIPVVTGDLVAVSSAVEEDPYTGHRSIDLARKGRRGGGEEGRRRKRHCSCAINTYVSSENANSINYIHTYEFKLEWHVHVCSES